MSESRIPFDGCPLCESPAVHSLRVADCTKHPHYQPALPPTMTWLECDACAHVFTDGYWPPSALELLFRGTRLKQAVGVEVEQDRHKWARVVDRVTAVLGAADGAWLDIGFGRGNLLFTAAEWGYESVGIDLRADNVAELQKLGFEAHCVDLAAFEAPARFTVVSLADALEHFPFPKQALRQAAALLRPGGLVFVSMPNCDTIVWRAMDHLQNNPYWIELQHYHNFSRKRLYALLEEVGLTPVHYGVSDRYRACMDVLAQKGT